jgi:hypothetical protein
MASARKRALPVTSRANPAARNARSNAVAVCGSPFQIRHAVQVRRVSSGRSHHRRRRRARLGWALLR